MSRGFASGNQGQSIYGYIGEVKFYVGSSAPNNALLCDGSTIGNTNSTATYKGAEYETLFNLLKSGWGNAGTENFASGNNVKLPDLRGMFLRGAGSHSSLTMANGNPFAGPTLGSSENDQMQGHFHRTYYGSGGTYIRIDDGGNPGSSVTDGGVREPVSDGTNGTPRTGDETRPVSYGINYIIIYQ